MNNIIIFGAGGHGKVVADIICSAGYSLTGFFDDNAEITQHYGYPVFPVDDALSKNVFLVLGIGNNKIRRHLSLKLQKQFHFMSPLIHVSSVISPSASLGEGTCAMAGAIVNADTIIGRHVILNTGSQIDHDCIISDWVHIAPGSILCGGVKVGEGSFLGAGCSIFPGVSIGKFCVVGGGTVVTKDISDGCTVVGRRPCHIVT